MNHRFNIGDKIEARRNNGKIIQVEIKFLFEQKASVFWYEENVYHFRKFFYHEMVKSRFINQNPINQQSRNQLLFSKKKAKNRFLDSLIIISVFFILMSCFFVFLFL